MKFVKISTSKIFINIVNMIVCRYGMFSSVSGILKEEMTPHLGPIVARMMESVITQEGITVSLCTCT
jgi:hypothetical protein